MYIHICVYIYIYVCVYIYVYIHTHSYTHMHAHRMIRWQRCAQKRWLKLTSLNRILHVLQADLPAEGMCLRACGSVCVFVCACMLCVRVGALCVCGCVVCLYVFLCVYVFVYVCVCVCVCVCVHTFAYLSIRVCVCIFSPFYMSYPLLFQHVPIDFYFTHRSGTGSTKAGHRDNNSPRSLSGALTARTTTSQMSLRSHPPPKDEKWARWKYDMEKKWGPKLEKNLGLFVRMGRREVYVLYVYVRSICDKRNMCIYVSEKYMYYTYI